MPGHSWQLKTKDPEAQYGGDTRMLEKMHGPSENIKDLKGCERM